MYRLPPCVIGISQNNQAPAPDTGRKQLAPDFLLPGHPNRLRLSELRGTPVVLVFAPPGWDPVIHEQMALFNDVAAELAVAGGQLFGIAVDDIWCSLDLHEEQPVRFPLLRDLDPAGGIAQLYGVHGDRAIVVIDADGVICWRQRCPPGAVPRADSLIETLRMLAMIEPDAQQPCTTGLPGLPMDRRQFLATALALSLTVTLWPKRLLAETPAVATATAALPPVPPQMRETRLQVNGVEHALTLDTRVSLLDALREAIGLTGTKKGCDQGTCGACTVLADGQRILSCLTLAAMAQGKRITTIEGLANGSQLHPVQQAFIDHDALQCGYCTPGQIMSAVALIAEGHAGSDQDIRDAMSGNLCRCGAYPNIVAAIRAAAKGSTA